MTSTWGGTAPGPSREEAQHLFEAKLAESKLTLADAEEYGVRLVTTHDARQRGYSLAAVTYWSLEFVYVTPQGKLLEDGDGRRYLRWRRLGPLLEPWKSKLEKDPKAEVPKYLQPKGSAPHIYLTPGLPWQRIMRDASVPLWITEGEFKALSSNKHSLPATIALGGVDSFRSKKLGIAFLPELEAFAWKGRQVTVIFDSDVATNRRVQGARWGLVKCLRERRAIAGHKDLAQL